MPFANRAPRLQRPMDAEEGSYVQERDCHARTLLDAPRPPAPNRYIPQEEVLEALVSGTVNDRKSRPALRPCPKYVVDARVGPKGKSVQVRVPGLPAAGPQGRAGVGEASQPVLHRPAAAGSAFIGSRLLGACSLALPAGGVLGLQRCHQPGHGDRPRHQLGLPALLASARPPLQRRAWARHWRQQWSARAAGGTSEQLWAPIFDSGA